MRCDRFTGLCNSHFFCLLTDELKNLLRALYNEGHFSFLFIHKCVTKLSLKGLSCNIACYCTCELYFHLPMAHVYSSAHSCNILPYYFPSHTMIRIFTEHQQPPLYADASNSTILSGKNVLPFARQQTL